MSDGGLGSGPTLMQVTQSPVNVGNTVKAVVQDRPSTIPDNRGATPPIQTNGRPDTSSVYTVTIARAPGAQGHAYAFLQWSAGGAQNRTATIDVGRGVQFSICASALTVSAGVYHPNPSVYREEMISIWVGNLNVSKAYPLTCTQAGQLTADASGKDFPIPNFAATFQLTREVATVAVTVKFQDDSGNVLETVEVASGAVCPELRAPPYTAKANVVCDGATWASGVWGLSL